VSGAATSALTGLKWLDEASRPTKGLLAEGRELAERKRYLQNALDAVHLEELALLKKLAEQRHWRSARILRAVLAMDDGVRQYLSRIMHYSGVRK